MKFIKKYFEDFVMTTQALQSNQNHAVWGLAGTLVWSFVISIFFVITQAIVMVIWMAFVLKSGDESLMNEIEYDGLMLSISTFATLIICTLIMFLAIKIKKNSDIKDYLGLKTIDFKTIKFWFLVIVVFLIVTDILTYLMSKPMVPDFMVSIYETTNYKWFLFLALVVAAPLFEELFFRGFLISGLSSTFLKPIGAVIISSVFWAYIHLQYDMYLILTIFALGLILGTIRIKTGSILLTIGLHSFVNTVAFVEVFIWLS